MKVIYDLQTDRLTIILPDAPVKDDASKRLIQISPYLEHWLLDRARQNRIAPKDFGLPSDPKELHSIPHVEMDRNFQGFLNEVVESDDEIDTLKKWILEVI